MCLLKKHEYYTEKDSPEFLKQKKIFNKLINKMLDEILELN